MLLLLVLLLLLVKRGIAPPLYTHFYTSNSKSDRVRSLFFVRLICYFSTLCARCCWICDFFECTIFHFSSAGTHCFFDVYVVVASLSVCLCVIDLNVYSRSLLFSPFFFSLVCQLLSQFYHANKCFSGDFSLSHQFVIGCTVRFFRICNTSKARYCIWFFIFRLLHIHLAYIHSRWRCAELSVREIYLIHISLSILF